MRTSIFSLLLFFVASSALAGPTDATLTWTPPTEYEDATPLPLNEIQSYKVYYGATNGGPYTSTTTVSGATTSVTISSLTRGTWYFVVTTIATNGLESVYSAQVSKTIMSNSRPKPPKALSVQ